MTMTGRELVALLAERPLPLAAVLLVPPLVALILPRLHGRAAAGGAPWKYFYSLLIYLTAIPGVLAAVLTAYTLFFTGENLLDVNWLVYLLPVAAMAMTLLFLGRRVPFDRLPGVDRLSGLIVLIAVTFAIVLAISKTRIWLVFGGSIATLGVLAAAVFAVLRWSARAAFRRPDESPEPPPSFPRLG